ncbi:MAG: TolC family protein [Rikenellaceae bacterium]|nr:TolC family protein [Rikenellaceae bacterium]
MRYILSIISVLAFAVSADAQRVLSLKECLETGLQNNYDLLIVRNEQQIAANNATAANAGMLPTLDLSAGYSGAADNTTTYPREGESETIKGAYDQVVDVGVGLGWTIFDGFKLRTNYKKLQEMKTLGVLKTRLEVEDFVANLTAEYYNLIQQTLRLKNYRYAVALSRERLRITEARYRIGDFSRLDWLQARVDFNADSSQYMSQQELVTASRIRINELMANNDVTEKCFARDSVIDVNSALKWEELESNMNELNSELLIANRNTAISELELKAIKSRNYPYLNLSAGYGYTRQLYGKNDPKGRGTLGPNVGLKLGFTIFDGNRRREQRNARIEVENAQYTQEQLKQSLMADLATFWQAYTNNLEVINLEQQNLVAAKENYEIAMERYLLGDLPGIEMREAQKSLLDAEERILTAEYNTKLCEISLMQISGNILEYLK